MCIKTTMRYHLTLVSMTITKKTKNNKFGKGVKKREPYPTQLLGMYIGAATEEISMEVPQKKNKKKLN